MIRRRIRQLVLLSLLQGSILLLFSLFCHSKKSTFIELIFAYTGKSNDSVTKIIQYEKELVIMNVSIPKWQQLLHTEVGKKKNSSYFLVVAAKVRIYEEDKARWTVKELKQWMHYMFWAGAEHIYLCDHFRNKSEILKEKLQRYIDLSLVTYIPFDVGPNNHQKQLQCYQHIIDDFKDVSVWQTALDMDEYPYIPDDVSEGFLKRYLEQFSENISEVSMPNFILLGQGNHSFDLIIERIDRIYSLTKKTNNLDKALYRPKNVKAALHHQRILKGKRIEEDGKRIKMLHYWGARTQGWGPDTPETLKNTVQFTEVREKLGFVIRNSLLSFGEVHAFSNITGP